MKLKSILSTLVIVLLVSLIFLSCANNTNSAWSIEAQFGPGSDLLQIRDVEQLENEITITFQPTVETLEFSSDPKIKIEDKYLVGSSRYADGKIIVTFAKFPIGPRSFTLMLPGINIPLDHRTFQLSLVHTPPDTENADYQIDGTSIEDTANGTFFAVYYHPWKTGIPSISSIEITNDHTQVKSVGTSTITDKEGRLIRGTIYLPVEAKQLVDMESSTIIANGFRDNLKATYHIYLGET